MRLRLAPSTEQAAALEQLLEEQRDPGSANYNRWLTPEEFGERFGAGAEDLGAICAWLESEGFHIDGVARASNFVAFSGTADQVARTFHTALRRVESGGQEHYANVTEPTVPEALGGVIETIEGLNDFRPHPNRVTVRKRDVHPEFSQGNGSHYLAPDDLAAIYDVTPFYQAGYDGTGQKIAVAGQTDVSLTDVAKFRSTFGLAVRPPQVMLYGPDPGVVQGDDIEAALDVEWAGAVARNATVIFVNSKNVFTSAQYAIDQNIAPVLTVSYGACEAGISATYRSLVQQANAQGITWIASSGDSGAAGCDYDVAAATHGPQVSFPADLPEVTAVGGTEFAEGTGTYWKATNTTSGGSAIGYIPEKAWNDAGSILAASGGGASKTYSKPWWQTGAGVPADGARDIPDVSLSASAAHDGYIIQAEGNMMAVGGTSASAPSFAGMLVLLNQYLTAKGVIAKPGLGNVNPNLYALASAPGVFHDIVNGSNVVPCTKGSTGCTTGSFGFAAGTGYDLVTGIGSVDAYQLAQQWAAAAASVGTTTTVASSLSAISTAGSTVLMATVKPVSGTKVPTGTVNFTLGNGSTLGSATLNASGVATVTVPGSGFVAGTNTVTASYAGTGVFKPSTGTATITVTVPLVSTSVAILAAPASIVQTGSTMLTAMVRPAAGTANPAGTVTFTTGTKTLGTVNVAANATALLTVPGSQLALGTNTIQAAYKPSNSFTASTGATNVTVTAPQVATTTTIASSAAKITATTTSVTFSVTVKPAVGVTAPTGTVQISAGKTLLGTVTLTANGANAAGSLTVKSSALPSGATTINAVYSGATGFTASSGSVTETK